MDKLGLLNNLTSLYHSHLFDEDGNLKWHGINYTQKYWLEIVPEEGESVYLEKDDGECFLSLGKSISDLRDEYGENNFPEKAIEDGVLVSFDTDVYYREVDNFICQKYNLKSEQEIQNVLDTPVEELEYDFHNKSLSVNVTKMLKDSGYNTIGDILCEEPQALINKNNIDIRTVTDIVKAVQKTGIEYASEFLEKRQKECEEQFFKKYCEAAKDGVLDPVEKASLESLIYDLGLSENIFKQSEIRYVSEIDGAEKPVEPVLLTASHESVLEFVSFFNNHLYALACEFGETNKKQKHMLPALPKITEEDTKTIVELFDLYDYRIFADYKHGNIYLYDDQQNEFTVKTLKEFIDKAWYMANERLDAIPTGDDWAKKSYEKYFDCIKKFYPEEILIPVDVHYSFNLPSKLGAADKLYTENGAIQIIDDTIKNIFIYPSFPDYKNNEIIFGKENMHFDYTYKHFIACKPTVNYDNINYKEIASTLEHLVGKALNVAFETIPLYKGETKDDGTVMLYTASDYRKKYGKDPDFEPFNASEVIESKNMVLFDKDVTASRPLSIYINPDVNLPLETISVTENDIDFYKLTPDEYLSSLKHEQSKTKENNIQGKVEEYTRKRNLFIEALSRNPLMKEYVENKWNGNAQKNIRNIQEWEKKYNVVCVEQLENFLNYHEKYFEKSELQDIIKIFKSEQTPLVIDENGNIAKKIEYNNSHLPYDESSRTVLFEPSGLVEEYKELVEKKDGKTSYIEKLDNIQDELFVHEIPFFNKIFEHIKSLHSDSGLTESEWKNIKETISDICEAVNSNGSLFFNGYSHDVESDPGCIKDYITDQLFNSPLMNDSVVKNINPYTLTADICERIEDVYGIKFPSQSERFYIQPDTSVKFRTLKNIPKWAAEYMAFGDEAGGNLTKEEISQIEDFMKNNNISSVVEISDSSYFVSHPEIGNLASDCVTVNVALKEKAFEHDSVSDSSLKSYLLICNEQGEVNPSANLQFNRCVDEYWNKCVSPVLKTLHPDETDPSKNITMKLDKIIHDENWKNVYLLCKYEEGLKTEDNYKSSYHVLKITTDDSTVYSWKKLENPSGVDSGRKEAFYSICSDLLPESYINDFGNSIDKELVSVRSKSNLDLTCHLLEYDGTKRKEIETDLLDYYVSCVKEQCGKSFSLENILSKAGNELNIYNSVEKEIINKALLDSGGISPESLGKLLKKEIEPPEHKIVRKRNIEHEYTR